MPKILLENDDTVVTSTGLNTICNGYMITICKLLIKQFQVNICLNLNAKKNAQLAMLKSSCHITSNVNLPSPSFEGTTTEKKFLFDYITAT